MPQQQYQQDRAYCTSGQATEDRATCLKEAAAAYAAIDRIQRTDWADYLSWYKGFLGIDPRYRTCVTRIEPAGEFPIVRAGKEVRTVRLYRCVRQVAPFPFDYDGPSRAGRRMEPGAMVAGGRDWR